MTAKETIVDVCVVGGGPAGLSAALLLGRCHRTVIVVDEGRPRNARSQRVNCYLGLPHVAPHELLEAGRAQLAGHPEVSFRPGRVAGVARVDGGFEIKIEGGNILRSRALILATGLIDRLPEIDGIAECYGTSVFTCPYCDGWEHSGKPLGIMGRGSDAAAMAMELRLWSDVVHLFIEGDHPSVDEFARLEGNRITVQSTPVTSLEHANGKLLRVHLADGRSIPCEALFLLPDQVQHDSFCEQAGYPVSDECPASTGACGATSVPGLYVAGNASKGLQLAMVAAAEGLECAAAANDWLLSTFPVSGYPASPPNRPENAKSSS